FSAATAVATSPSIRRAFHVVSFNVRDATYLGRLFMRSANPSASVRCGHAATNASYVTRPSSRASLRKSCARCICSSSLLQNGIVHEGSSTTPSTDTYSAHTTRLIVGSSHDARDQAESQRDDGHGQEQRPDVHEENQSVRRRRIGSGDGQEKAQR